uniref:Sugar phosphate phosphatase n=1 Tax=Caenorhabditis japonica TaxID=281687 RepID=A0A8R1HN70_CAEJA
MESSEVYDHMAPKLTGKKEGTFAYLTVRDRWPKIVTKLVDQLTCRRKEYAEMFGEEAEDDIKSILEKFSEVRYRIMTDKPLVYLTGGRGGWDQYLTENMTSDLTNPDEITEKLTWFNGPWLLVECYLYQFIYNAFAVTRHLKEVDYFEDSKRTNFNDHLPQIEEASRFLLKITAENAPVHELFGIGTILKMSLWGNRADMSLTGGDNNTLKMSAMVASQTLSDFVLVDDIADLTAKVLAPLLTNKSKSRRMDIVLDNAGVELTGDLVLAEFMICRGFADSVVLHGKNIPWFVSDVTQRDFEWTLSSLERAGEQSKKLGERLKERVANGQIRFECHRFWTSPHATYKMKTDSPDLYADFETSSLAIFKGDLNYRKLIGDRDWDLDTSFEKACRGFAPCPFFALRTLKAETVAGLSKEAVRTILEKFDEDNSWMTSGEYAVCQLGGI